MDSRDRAGETEPLIRQRSAADEGFCLEERERAGNNSIPYSASLTKGEEEGVDKP